MFSAILQIMRNGFECAYSAFGEVVNAVGMSEVIIGIVFACMVTRFLIMPVLGGRQLSIGSDGVKRRRNE